MQITQTLRSPILAYVPPQDGNASSLERASGDTVCGSARAPGEIPGPLVMRATPAARGLDLEAAVARQREALRLAWCSSWAGVDERAPLLDCLAAERVDPTGDQTALAQAAAAAVARKIEQDPLPESWIGPALHLMQGRQDREDVGWSPPLQYQLAGPIAWQSRLAQSLETAWARGDFEVVQTPYRAGGLRSLTGSSRVDVEGRTVRPTFPRRNAQEAVAMLHDIPERLYGHLQKFEEDALATWVGLAHKDPGRCAELLTDLADHCKFPRGHGDYGFGMHDDLSRLTTLLELARSHPDPALAEVARGQIDSFLSIPVSLDRCGLLQAGAGHVHANDVPERFLVEVARLDPRRDVSAVADRFLKPTYVPYGEQLSKAARMGLELSRLHPEQAGSWGEKLLAAVPASQYQLEVLQGLLELGDKGWQASPESLQKLAAWALVGPVRCLPEQEQRTRVLELLLAQERARPGLLGEMHLAGKPFAVELLNRTLANEPAGPSESDSSWGHVSPSLLMRVFESSPEAVRQLWLESNGADPSRSDVACQLLAHSKITLEEAESLGRLDERDPQAMAAGRKQLRNAAREVLLEEGSPEEGLGALPFFLGDGTVHLSSQAMARVRELIRRPLEETQSRCQWLREHDLGPLQQWDSATWSEIQQLQADTRNRRPERQACLEALKPALLTSCASVTGGQKASLAPWRAALAAESVTRLREGPATAGEVQQALHTLQDLVARDAEAALAGGSGALATLAHLMGREPKSSRDLLWPIALEIPCDPTMPLAQFRDQVTSLADDLDSLAAWKKARQLFETGLSWPEAVAATREVSKL